MQKGRFRLETGGHYTLIFLSKATETDNESQNNGSLTLTQLKKAHAKAQKPVLSEGEGTQSYQGEKSVKSV